MVDLTERNHSMSGLVIEFILTVQGLCNTFLKRIREAIMLQSPTEAPTCSATRFILTKLCRTVTSGVGNSASWLRASFPGE